MAKKSGIDIQTIQDVTVVDFTEPSILEAYQIEQITDEIARVLEQDEPRKLLLDFTRVHHLSSQALGMLLDVRKKVKAISGDMVLCGVQPEIQRIFKITSLHKVFEFQQTPREALAHFGITLG